MAITKPIRETIQMLKADFDRLRPGKESLLRMLDEAEVPESVYNSNAIENSTLTLKETERILLEMEVERKVNLREVYEAKNLARVFAYVREKLSTNELTKEFLLLFHQMLISNINDSISGRFRKPGEYVRVGTHVAPAPEKIEGLLDSALTEYTSDHSTYFLDAITRFHLTFETIHPFNDGNGRIGRVLVNYQLQQRGYPGLIVRNKEKIDYYRAFPAYREAKNTKPMEKIFSLALMESLHKRIAYLRGANIIPLTEYVKQQGQQASAVLNAARRQNISAFREKGVWKIGV